MRVQEKHVPWNGLDADGLGAALPAIDMARLNIEEIPPTPPEPEGGAVVSCTVDCLCQKNTILSQQTTFKK